MNIEDVRAAVDRARLDAEPAKAEAEAKFEWMNDELKPRFGAVAGQDPGPALSIRELEAMAGSARQRGWQDGFREGVQEEAEVSRRRIERAHAEAQEAGRLGVLGGLTVAIDALEALPSVSKSVEEIVQSLRGLRAQVRDEGVDA